MIHDYERDITKHCKQKVCITLPKGYADSDEPWPVIVNLHTAGGFTSIADLPLFTGSIVIEPICEFGDIFRPDSIYMALQEILGNIGQDIINKDKIAICGASMGARGVWDTICSYPNLFSCAVPISGFACYLRSSRIQHMPIWAFHGKQDTTVPPDEAIKMINSLGNNARMTLGEGGHGAYWNVYYSKVVREWINGQSLMKNIVEKAKMNEEAKKLQESNVIDGANR